MRLLDLWKMWKMWNLAEFGRLWKSDMWNLWDLWNLGDQNQRLLQIEVRRGTVVEEMPGFVGIWESDQKLLVRPRDSALL